MQRARLGWSLVGTLVPLIAFRVCRKAGIIIIIRKRTKSPAAVVGVAEEEEDDSSSHFLVGSLPLMLMLLLVLPLSHPVISQLRTIRTDEGLNSLYERKIPN